MMDAVATYQETASALGMSVDRVRKVEKRAFRKLQRDPELRNLAQQTGFFKTTGRTHDARDIMAE